MNEFEELLNSVGDVKVGDVVSGEILTVEDGQATVAIVGTGVEGVLTLRELTSERDADINDFVKSGDVKDLLVVKQIVGKESEGANVYLLSEKRLAARKAFTDLEGKEGEVVIVKVLKDVKGGLSVDLNGVRGFIPASMIDTYFVRDTKKFVGEEFEAKIIEVNAADKRFILSRRAVIEEESKAQRAEAFANLHEGDIVEGTVARTTDFGAFINLGGVDGLVHVTELAHGRVKKPSDVVTVGETVQVKVLKVDEEAGRVSLSLKATQPGPWDEIEEKAPVGTVLDGTVKRITDFGAFVEIFPGVEGLVHISQISWERVENAKDVLTVGQAVQVKVLDVKPAEERISLSIKALAEAPARKERTNDSAGSSAAQGGQRRDAKPRAPRRNTKPEYTLPETQEGFSLADFLGEDFDINNF
ncbi:MAG: 30S ribosomal protein S1 [Lactococcus sp.]|jgi:small subunit ribosomal protein S1|uniref:30S ribosomal protein S1 RpsA n=2 Tax=Pseudolactococcus piscium TaxID=1364 RepID=A0A0D6DWF3_9LACT|nr:MULTISPECIES: 30S ribosomal protein S1 [Lactococcus]MBR6895186.1 30S ribosomal protein S1 [Lactococcus sp.]MCJ1971694.1 30S ribosomal protein S1 [Lactococcus carnosus]MCJ1974604.1 30S ribosomal protein S1 [Lactococcus carnosus]MCJ1978767.1 30S ribosomal protein S1 [Lactococcus carnosus]MCJ1985046.1 30S ribosomal protein S1 [Lactococcus carnosus]